jgi:hypothetical protein
MNLIPSFTGLQRTVLECTLWWPLVGQEGRQHERNGGCKTVEMQWDTLRMSSGCGLVGCDAM